MRSAETEQNNNNSGDQVIEYQLFAWEAVLFVQVIPSGEGVSYYKRYNKWQSQCNGIYLGYFYTEEEAFDAYCNYYQDYVYLYRG